MAGYCVKWTTPSGDHERDYFVPRGTLLYTAYRAHESDEPQADMMYFIMHLIANKVYPFTVEYVKGL